MNTQTATTAAGISIAGFAACTSIGYTLEATLAAMGAGLSNFIKTEQVTMTGQPASAALLLDAEMPRGQRLHWLLRHGLEDAATLLAPTGLGAVPLLLGVPADLNDDERQMIDQAVQAHPLISELLALQPYGRASGFAALTAARQLVMAGTHRAVLVGGVDSLCAPEILEQLIRADRILGPYCEGTIPGEAAVLALVTRSDDPTVDTTLAVQLENVALRREQQPFTRNEQISSEALTAVFRTFRESGTSRVHRIIAAHSGEGYFGRSFAHAYLRETEVMPEPLDLEQIADCTGDLGAAAALMGLALGTYLMARDARPEGGRALIYTESDGGETGAAIIAGHPTDWHRPNTLQHPFIQG